MEINLNQVATELEDCEKKFMSYDYPNSKLNESSISYKNKKTKLNVNGGNMWTW